MLNEFSRLVFRKKSYQGRWCYSKTPTQTFVDSVPLAKEKILAASTRSGLAVCQMKS